MRTLGNILWVIISGLWLAIGFLIAAVLMAITIIGIPFALQAIKLAAFSLWPFGRTVVDRPGASAAASGCGNILWFLLCGWWLALLHIITGLILVIFIITIPFALQNFKLALFALMPFGREVVTIEEAARRRGAGTISPDGLYMWNGTGWVPRS